MSKKKSIFQLLTEKPWETDQIEADNDHEGRTVNLTKQKLGLRTRMAASSVLFSLFIVAYSDRMLVSDWRNMPEPWLLWLNTGILIISSLVFHQTTKYAQKEIFDKTKNGLYFIGFFVSDCDCASIWTEENANNIASTENKCNENLFFITY